MGPAERGVAGTLRKVDGVAAPDALRSLERWGATTEVLVALDALRAHPGDGIGRVARVDRIRVKVVDESGPRWAEDGGLGPLCAGDWVVTSDGEHDVSVAVRAVLPRRSSLIRSAASDRSPQVLAANMDEVWLVLAADQVPDETRLERLLILARDSAAEPVVVLTKCDAAPVAPHLSLLGTAAPDVPVMCVSSVTGSGITGLSARLGPGRTAALVGLSGAGKSSLVNALVGAEQVATGAVREADGKGRHTTTWRELVGLPDGGVVVDTPGLRSLGLWLDGGGIDATFFDVIRLAEQCRFSNCRHTVEPDCAVREAIEAGTLDRDRYQRWVDLHHEAAEVAERLDARVAAQNARPQPTGGARPPRSRRR